MSVITDVVDQQRLYLSLGPSDALGKQLGRSISFSPGLHGSLPITINATEHIVSRESFKKHLASIGCSDVNPTDIITSGYNNFIRQRERAITLMSTLMVSELSQEWRLDRYKKLITAIFDNNCNEVLLLARQGAFLEKKFHCINQSRYGFEDENFLPSQKAKRTAFLYFTLTPLTLAVKLGFTKIAGALYKLKPDTRFDTITSTLFENGSDGSSRTQRLQITQDDPTKSIQFSFV